MGTASGLIDRGWEARRKGRLEDAHRDLDDAVRACREVSEPAELVRALKALAHGTWAETARGGRSTTRPRSSTGNARTS